MKSLIILGRQPSLGVAELESLYGSDNVRPLLPSSAALLNKPVSQIDFNRLGGSIKLAEVLSTVKTDSWRAIENQLEPLLIELATTLPAGKLKLGLSAYGMRTSARDINTTALRLKKILKSHSRSTRVIPNKLPALNSAQVLHNQLTGSTGIEIVIVREAPNRMIIARTVVEQDINAYSKRDQNRPKRDARVGMLPPKLAQIIINLAKPPHNGTTLDPFCGTGVILQESLLMGLGAYGTDIDPRMIEYSKANIDWLSTTGIYQGTKQTTFEVADATSHSWLPVFDSVAGETFLGKPLSSLPPDHILEPIIREADNINDKFLRNLSRQLKPGTRLCLALPAWRTKNNFLHLQSLDHLTDMGYTRVSFVHVRDSDLIYHRPDQTVARELVILEKT